MSDSVKVFFQLQQDEDGYPPVAVESVWAESGTKEDEYVIDNVPFFVRDATIGDRIATRNKDGNHWFEQVMHRSDNSLLRVVFFDRSCIQEISNRLILLGCAVEYSQNHNLLAVSVPGHVSLKDVQFYLQAEAAAGIIDYEEAILRQ